MAIAKLFGADRLCSVGIARSTTDSPMVPITFGLQAMTSSSPVLVRNWLFPAFILPETVLNPVATTGQIWEEDHKEIRHKVPL
jgi:hypothetical protein